MIWCNMLMIILSGDGFTEDCAIEVTEGWPTIGPPDCVYWVGTYTDDTNGLCGPIVG